MIPNNDMSLQDLCSKEWIITNGLGSYASSSILGMNTRRYHGLWVNAFNPPADRKVILSKIDEKIVVNPAVSFSISTNQYPGTVHPEGHKYFKWFERKPVPMMKFQVLDHHVLKSVFMVYGSNTTVVEYENTGETSYKLRLNPHWVYRDYHSLFRENEFTNFWIDRQGDHFVIYPHYGATPIYFSFTHGEYFESREWYRNTEYAREADRGLDFHEDVYSLFYIDVVLKPGQKIQLLFSEDQSILNYSSQELKYLNQNKKDCLSTGLYNDLCNISEQFIVKRKSTENYSLIAGYHWFTDWGRDTMIAMRGITVTTHKQEISKSIINTFLQFVSNGMLPNRFPDQGEQVEYNTIDATLWLFIAVYEYYLEFDDEVLIRQCLPIFKDIIDWHIRGTRYNIKANSITGFLYGGTEGLQLTWMDAKVGGQVITPRIGYPVEIQALWYNALNIYTYLTKKLNEQTNIQYLQIINKIEIHFLKHFWDTENNYLYDVLDNKLKPDRSFRPNQLYAASLPYPLIFGKEKENLFAELRSKLWTPYGLRTLSPDHVDFKPNYTGDQWSRDCAYHQGSVWPFLLSEYYKVYFDIYGTKAEIIADVEQQLAPLVDHFYKQNDIYGISEIFDGLHPFEGKGTANQAWSVGAMLQIVKHLQYLKSIESKQKPMKSALIH